MAISSKCVGRLRGGIWERDTRGPLTLWGCERGGGRSVDGRGRPEEAREEKDRRGDGDDPLGEDLGMSRLMNRIHRYTSSQNDHLLDRIQFIADFI